MRYEPAILVSITTRLYCLIPLAVATQSLNVLSTIFTMETSSVDQILLPPGARLSGPRSGYISQQSVPMSSSRSILLRSQVLEGCSFSFQLFTTSTRQRHFIHFPLIQIYSLSLSSHPLAFQLFIKMARFSLFTLFVALFAGLLVVQAAPFRRPVPRAEFTAFTEQAYVSQQSSPSCTNATTRSYADFQISDGTAGNAQAKANAVFVSTSHTPSLLDLF